MLPTVHLGPKSSSFVVGSTLLLRRFQMSLPTNPVVDLLLSHSSDRKYKPDPIDEGVLKQILLCGQRTASSKNSQCVSVIVVKDPCLRQELAKLSNNQAYVAECPVFLVVCGDHHKSYTAVKAVTGKRSVVADTTDGFVVMCVDAGIVLEAMMLAARSFDLGVVPIGGIRDNALSAAKLLKLPQRVVPLCGLCIGHVEKHSPLKPRMSLETFAHENCYDESPLEAGITKMDSDVKAFWEQVVRVDGKNWSETMAAVQLTDPRPNLKSEFGQQGIRF
eukprot:Protomagalhaensia_wolfi_Nauph_80__5642@NODE_651_length_2161_cov_90_815269_g487_i0_p1_GENE_NODE_651_length_2161_cov_90_815269_g487_i0NODE_651_length_2161_cov_90_815269_g487_i0_p1_ORF_typecomplete_len276_score64_11Nitroreductase/PF00881_24/1_6e26TM1586_NiRdase/PF14512_6/1_1e13Meiotic_rec114/PF03525_14/39Meiotic_rec114/PF03525_14/1_1DUF4796/PF16044_5/0_2_NODE_651_length_2161_cov_90_815269_g487_i012562083